MKASAINTVGITVAVSGILVSWIIYQTSIPQPPPTDPVERALTQPYHSVEAGDYHKSQYWWYEENDDDSNSGSSSLGGIHSHDVALVTGANTGIGKAIAIGLCQMGVGTVVITSRSLRRAQDAVDDMISSGACTVGQVDAMAVDLADFKSVRTLATMFRSKYDRLNYFVENAGGIILPIGGYKGPYMTEDGFEYLYAGNYLGHFLLLNLLIDLVETSTPSRISITSSIAHWGADIHNLSSLLPTGRRARTSQEGDGIISGFEQYCNTKFLQIAMAFELQARLGSESNVTVIPVAPGLVSTNIPSADRNKQMAGNPLAMTPTEGAKTTLHALFSPTVEKTQGYFLQPYWSPLHQNRPIGPLGISLLPWEWMFQRLSWGPHLWLSHPDTHRREFQKQLWDESYAAVGL